MPNNPDHTQSDKLTSSLAQEKPTEPNPSPRTNQNGQATTSELDRFFELSLDMLCIAGTDGYFQRVNPAFEKTLGWTTDELLSRPFFDFVYPEDLSATVAEIEKLAQGITTVEFENRFYCRDGSSKWLAWNAQPTPDGTLYAIARDVTERKQAEEALQKSEAALRAFVNAIPDVSFIIDSDGRYVEVLAAEESLLYAEASQLKGRTFHEILPAATADLFLAAVQRTIETQSIQTIQYPLPVPEGERWFEGRLSPIRQRLGDKSSVVWVAYDITARKQTEAILAKRAAEMETVAKVSIAATTLLDTHEMLQTVVDLTKENFDLYHAHVYLLDQSGNTLELAAGAGAIGRRMVAEGRRISIAQAQSLVARAARTRQGVIVNYVQADPGFLPHPLLPHTRSEMAVPMIVGGNVLGVLDMQSDEIDHFTDEDVRIETILAAQVAVALQNARSFERSEKALQELDLLTRRLTREGWATYLATTPAEMRFAYELQPEKPVPAEAPADVIEKPLTVQGEIVGRLALTEPQTLTDEAAIILDTVAERLSTHLETLRLTEQTEQALGQTEALYQGSGRVIQAKKPDEVLHALLDSTALGRFDRAAIAYFDRPWGDEPPQMVTTAAMWDRDSMPLGLNLEGRSGLTYAPTQYSLRQFPTLHLLQRDVPLVFFDVALDERLDEQTRTFLQQLAVRTMVIFPLVAAGEWFGLLTGQAQEALDIREDEIRQIRSLVDQAATVIQNQRLYAAAQARAERERQVRTITDKIRQGVDREAMLRIAAKELSQMLGASQFVARLGLREQLLAAIQPAEAERVTPDADRLLDIG